MWRWHLIEGTWKLDGDSVNKIPTIEESMYILSTVFAVSMSYWFGLITRPEILDISFFFVELCYGPKFSGEVAVRCAFQPQVKWHRGSSPSAGAAVVPISLVRDDGRGIPRAFQ